MYELGWIRQSLGPDWKAFENILKAALDSPYALLSNIDSYLLKKPGKQLRPVLALCAARICGTPGPLSHAVAAIAEMIHTASLLHDDVADNADMRRGTLSVQKQYGPRASILMGITGLRVLSALCCNTKGRTCFPCTQMPSRL